MYLKSYAADSIKAAVLEKLAKAEFEKKKSPGKGPLVYWSVVNINGSKMVFPHRPGTFSQLIEKIAPHISTLCTEGGMII